MILSPQGGKGAVFVEKCYLYLPMEASELFAVPQKGPESKQTNKQKVKVSYLGNTPISGSEDFWSREESIPLVEFWHSRILTRKCTTNSDHNPSPSVCLCCNVYMYNLQNLYCCSLSHQTSNKWSPSNTTWKNLASIQVETTTPGNLHVISIHAVGLCEVGRKGWSWQMENKQYTARWISVEWIKEPSKVHSN